MSDDLFGGRIRFVGGPKHNQIMGCEWRPQWRFPIPIKHRAVFDLGHDPEQLPDNTVTYELRKFVTARRAIFFEYHVAGVKDDVSKDFAECPL